MANLSKEPELIVTRTPLRVSFAGGGTDLPEFYKRDYGAVLSTAINKYLYVTLKRHGQLYDEKYRLNYSETEQVDELDQIENAIARECLRFLKVGPPIYISTVADLPAHSGLGSSSSFAVGLLNALHALQGERASASQLAEEAAHVEIDVLGHPIGKQDHYVAAFGGLNYFTFLSDGRVTIEPQHLSNDGLNGLFGRMLLFSTGMWRDANAVLAEQQRVTANKLDSLLKMREHAAQLKELFQNGFSLQEFGQILDEGWHTKRQLTDKISNTQIDNWHDLAIAAGATGGKLCGAGGGGFLLFLAETERQEAIRKALSDMDEVLVGYESQGSRLLLVE